MRKPNYVLQGDTDWINDNHSRYSCYEHPHYIHSELLPNPFMGHPSAPIWILTINPSWCHVDLFDLSNSSAPARVYSESPLCDDSKQRTASFYDDKATVIGARIEKQIRQLALQPQVGFLPFNPEFNTCHVKGKVSYGAYGWWKKCLVGSKTDKFPLAGLWNDKGDMAGIFGRTVFVMEFSPYRSRHFEYDALAKSHAGKYGQFWDKMVRYAFDKRKQLIVRAEPRTRRNLIVQAIEKLGLDSNASFVTRLSSCRQFTVSKGRIANSSVYKRIREIVRNQIQQ